MTNVILAGVFFVIFAIGLFIIIKMGLKEAQRIKEEQSKKGKKQLWGY